MLWLPNNWLRLLILGLMACAVARARDKHDIEIVKIHSAKQWKMNEQICFHRENEMVACGKVVGLSSYLVAIRVPSLADRVSKGDRLFVAPPGPGRQPSSYGDTYVVTRSTSYFVRNITAGAFAGIGYWFPSAHIQLALVPGLTLGFMPAYNRPALGTSVLGTFLTLEWFFGGNSYSGFSLMGAAGLYTTTGNSSGAAWQGAGHLTLGYRFITRSGFNFGLGLGTQYNNSTSAFTRGGSNVRLFGGSAFQLLGRADLGFAF